MKKLKKILLGGIVSCMMLSTVAANTAYADYGINVEDITGKIESEDFKQLVLTYVSDGEVYSCSEADLRAANIGQAFQIPNIDDEGNADYGNKIWYSPVIKDNQVLAVITCRQLQNYPVFAQGSTNLCWAGTIASMVKYEFPSQYSGIVINDVCKAVNYYDGAEWDIIQKGMNYYFKSPYVPTLIESPLTREQVKVVVQNDDPGLMSSLNPSKTSAHITALIGYKDTPAGMSVKIMNPGTGKLEWGNYSTSAFSYSYNNETYKWDKTIRLFYR